VDIADNNVVRTKNLVGVVELTLLWRVPVAVTVVMAIAIAMAMAMASSMELEMEDVSSCCLAVAHCILDWDLGLKKGAASNG